MNVILTAGLTILAASTSITAAPVTAYACSPRVLQSDTDFPIRSQLRGHKGTVLLDVRIDAQGRATHVDVNQSSGHRLLDVAATRSILSEWQFDISSCKTFPAVHQVAVEYRNQEY